jgi:hypothetical protein
LSVLLSDVFHLYFSYAKLLAGESEQEYFLHCLAPTPCHEQNIGRNKNRELMSFSNFPKQKNLSDYVKQNDSFEAISKYRLDYPV